VSALRSAAVAFAAVLIAFGIMYALCARLGVNNSPAILAAALCVTLARSSERLDVRAAASRLISLIVLALAAGLVGLCFRTIPALGAALFCVCVALSVWLRNYGERGSAFGRIIAMPFIVMLVVPVRVEGMAPGTGALLVIAAGAVAYASNTFVQRVTGIT